MLSAIFVAVPAFNRVEPVRISGPVARSISRSKASPCDPRRIAGQQNRLRAALLRPRERAEHERSPSARADSADDIRAGHAAFVDRQRATARFVFRSLDAAMKRAHSAGHNALHHFRRSAERRRNFARVEHAEPSARSSADIKQAAALLQNAAHHFDATRQRRGLFAQRIRDAIFFGDEKLDQISRA